MDVQRFVAPCGWTFLHLHAFLLCSCDDFERRRALGSQLWHPAFFAGGRTMTPTGWCAHLICRGFCRSSSRSSHNTRRQSSLSLANPMQDRNQAQGNLILSGPNLPLRRVLDLGWKWSRPVAGTGPNEARPLRAGDYAPNLERQQGAGQTGIADSQACL